MKKPSISLCLMFSFFMILFAPCASKTTWAGGNDIDLSGFPAVQSQFEDLSKELGLALSYIPMAPAEPLGVLGFDVGIEGTFAKIDSGAAYWTAAVSDGNPPDYLPIPKLHVQKGLPFGFDVGAILAKAPGSNISLVGGELKWAILKGSMVSPAVAVRGSYTQLLGVDDLDLQTFGLDTSISKGFGPLTPYGGVGLVKIKASENSPIVTLQDVDASETKFFLGAKLSILLINLVAEADFAKIPLYSLRLNVGF